MAFWLWFGCSWHADGESDPAAFWFCSGGEGSRNEGFGPRKQAWVCMALLIVLGVYCVSQSMVYEDIILPFVPWICLMAVGYVAFGLLKADSAGPQKLARLVLYLLGLSLFFAAEEQMGSSLMLFSDRHATKTLLGIPIPPAVLQSINPAVIILFGTVMNVLMNALGQRWRGGAFRVVIPFGMAAAAFGGLAAACSYSTLRIPILLVMGAVLVISFAELMIGPAVYSLCFRSCHSQQQGDGHGACADRILYGKRHRGVLEQTDGRRRGDAVACDLSRRVCDHRSASSFGCLYNRECAYDCFALDENRKQRGSRMRTVTFTRRQETKGDLLLLPICQGEALSPFAEGLDKDLQNGHPLQHVFRGF